MLENENYLLERVIRANKEEYNIVQSDRDSSLAKKKQAYLPLKYKKGKIKMTLFYRKALMSFNRHNLATKEDLQRDESNSKHNYLKFNSFSEARWSLIEKIFGNSRFSYFRVIFGV